MKKQAKYEAATRKPIVVMDEAAFLSEAKQSEMVAWEREPRPSGTDLTPQMVESFIKQLRDRGCERINLK